MRRPRRRRTWIAAAPLVVLCAAALLVGRDVRRVARIRAGVTAKQMCSCVFVGSRDQAECRSDIPPMYDAVQVAVDRPRRAVRAWLTLRAGRVATYRDGAGCTLQ